ncbi:MAG: DNA helicase [Melioribacteraceae bacterium]|nr:MAG: DNA helicase [Melioribacteraceae bacterium]
MAWNDGIEIDSPAYNLAASDAATIRAVAGPGSGKSFAIKKRILRLLEAGVSPDTILAITFTRTAANDLKTEISSLGIEGANEVHSRTLHSHALRILMREGVLEQTGRIPRMIIEHEQKPILRDLDKPEFGSVRDKEQLLGGYLAAWARLQQDDPGFEQTPIEADFRTDLLDWFNEHGGILVGEVIPIVIEFLRNNPAVPFIGEYDYILVDEFQDLNKSEQEFIRLIRGDSNLVIVGDDDQSIYGFKYAHPQGIQQINELFGVFQDVPFDVCRRCPTLVTRMASELISKNPNRTLGLLNHFEENPDGQVDIVQWTDYEAELTGIADFISAELEKGVIEPADVLILTTRRKIGYRLRDLLTLREVPVKSYFRESVIDSKEVQRAFSLMNLLANPDDRISLRFLLGYNTGDFRKNQYKILMERAAENDISIRELLNSVLRGERPETNIRAITSAYRLIMNDLPNLRESLLNDPENGFQNYFVTADHEDDFFELDQAYRNVLEEIGIESLDEPENFDHWFQDVMKSLLESIALPDSPENIDHARIMSLHSSKGLSAKLVVLTSMIDPLIPFIPRDTPTEDRDRIIQEARRLFYVAITRCKASENYDGRLVISSFLSIAGIEALQMGISANPRGNLRTRTTRFVTDFGHVSPPPKRGEQLA